MLVLARAHGATDDDGHPLQKLCECYSFEDYLEEGDGGEGSDPFASGEWKVPEPGDTEDEAEEPEEALRNHLC